MFEPRLRSSFEDSEDKIRHRLFRAIYFNDLKEVQAIKRIHPSVYAQKHIFRLPFGACIDLRKLTYFNQIIWEDEDWSKAIFDFVKARRVETEELMTYWESEDPLFSNLPRFPYKQYWEYFYCEDPEDSTIVIVDDMTCFLERGFKAVDLLHLSVFHQLLIEILRCFLVILIFYPDIIYDFRLRCYLIH